AKAEKFATIILSLTDGLSPAAGAIVGLLPFFFLQMSLAVFILSFIFEIIILFLLGLYLGKISESNLYISGIEMIFAGLITALITLILEGGF
ncbi:MAG: VIT1/CCC1 transporter family protein, partial [Promethearchaeota archaeon]